MGVPHLEGMVPQFLLEDTNRSSASYDGECFLEPLGDRVVVKRDDFEYKGALYVPRGQRRMPTTGRVVAISRTNPEVDYVPLLGRKVFFGYLSGTEALFAGAPAYVLLNVSEILAIVTDESQKLEEKLYESLARTD